MKRSALTPPASFRRGSFIVISVLLLAACMQHEEALTPDQSRASTLSQGEMPEARGMSMLKKNVFTAHLSGANENPAVDTQGQGQAIFTLSDDGTALYYKLIVANTENIFAAHIHCGTPEDNGPVLAFLFGPVPGGVTVNGILAEGVITEITPRPSTPECSGGVATFQDLIEKIRTGGAYVNAHTVVNPSGEIRGQIK